MKKKKSRFFSFVFLRRNVFLSGLSLKILLGFTLRILGSDFDFFATSFGELFVIVVEAFAGTGNYLINLMNNWERRRCLEIALIGSSELYKKIKFFLLNRINL